MGQKHNDKWEIKWASFVTYSYREIDLTVLETIDSFAQKSRKIQLK